MGSVSLWDCGDNEGYNFRVTSSGSVQVENHSDSNEPAQEADVFVNGQKVINDADVPAMKAGTSWTSFDSINPPSGSWEWRVKGETDCGDRGEHEGDDPTKTPKPPTETPDPTATDTPEPTSTPVTPTHTVEPTDTPPTATKPRPTDPPRDTDTPKPDPSDTPRPPAPTSTQKPSATKPPATSTATSVTTEVPPTDVKCECVTPAEGGVEVWAYIHIEDAARDQLAKAIALGNEPLVKAVEQGGVSVLVEAELQPILYALVGIFAVLGGNLILAIYKQMRQ